jgi:hypothetical protein
MNFIPKLKIIPLATVIALGLALSPTLSIAGDKGHDKDNGRHKNQYSQDVGKPHIKQQRREQTVVHGFDGRGQNKLIKNYYSRPYVEHVKHVYYRNDPYRHEHHGHDHVKYIIVEDDHHEHFVDYDDVRFKIGVHTGNFDIVFRD